MFCNRCGFKNKIRSKYCINCGNGLSNVEYKRYSIICGIISIVSSIFSNVLCIVFGIFGIFYGIKYKKEFGEYGIGFILSIIGIILRIIFTILVIIMLFLVAYSEIDNNVNIPNNINGVEVESF